MKNDAFWNVVIASICSYTRNDLLELTLLEYYQIPTVSLSAVIFPVMYRYYTVYTNGFTNANASNFSAQLSELNPYLVPVNKGEDDFNTDFSIDHRAQSVYGDVRFSFEKWGGHLRVDKIHPTKYGHQYMTMLLAYCINTERDKLNMDSMRNSMGNSLGSNVNANDIDWDLYYRNELWIRPSPSSLPPILFDRGKALYTGRSAGKAHRDFYIAFANRLIPRTSIVLDGYIPYEGRSLRLSLTFPSLSQYMADVYGAAILTENEGEFKFVSETEWRKVGIICSEPIHCKLSMSIGAFMRNSADNIFETCSHIHVALLYLASYERMGSAAVWIDENKTINDAESREREVVDALHSDPSSQTIVHLLNYPCSTEEELFLHVQVVESQPIRKENKFKITGLAIGVN